MESNIPLPTDNIYKFYALFGLLLFVFSIGSTLYLGRTANEIIFQTYLEEESIKQIANPTSLDQAKKLADDKRREIAISNRTWGIRLLSGVSTVGILLMAYGFWKWHREVQPVQDEMAKLQLEKLRHEVSKLTKTGSPTPPREEPPEESTQPDA
jgi:hypothetical protein